MTFIDIFMTSNTSNLSSTRGQKTPLVKYYNDNPWNAANLKIFREYVDSHNDRPCSVKDKTKQYLNNSEIARELGPYQ